MRLIWIGLFLFQFSFLMLSQDKKAEEIQPKWVSKGQFDGTFSRVTLSNWAAGGNSTFSLNLNTVYNLTYKDKKQNWNTTFKGAYGLIREDFAEYQKSDDRFEINSKYGRNINKDFLLTAVYNVRSQFTATPYEENKDSIKSRFSSPAYHVFALGLDYHPSEILTVVVAPASGKMTVVLDRELSAAGAFGVDPNDMYRLEIGGYLKASYTQEVLKNITLSSDLELFSNYIENRQNVDVNWENRITARVNKWLSLTFNNQLIYDDDIKIAYTENGIEKKGPKLQYREVIGISLGITF